MTGIADELRRRLADAAAASARSNQREVGPSELGGCRTRLWHRTNGTERTNTTDPLPAALGTAIHAMLADLFPDAETEVELRGHHRDFGPVLGHADMLIGASVIDWKTTKKKSLPYFPSEAQWDQVHVYGWLARQNQRPCIEVVLVGIARDGGQDDIVVASQPYDERRAERVLSSAAAVRGLPIPPPPEMAVSFCRSWCGFYGACPGRAPQEARSAPLPSEAVPAALDALSAQQAMKEARARLESAREALQGIEGVGPGVRVGWRPMAGRRMPDLDALRAAGVDIPTRMGSPTSAFKVEPLE